MTASGFILVYGRIYTFYSTKWTFISGIFLFEVGSAICGAAPSSKVLIIGRAIAGFGSSGIFTGAIMIMVQSIPLHRRPIFQGLFGSVFGIASVAGPLMGGAFTDSKATWRWCFYINLPIGALTIAALCFFLHVDESKKKKDVPFLEKLKVLDPIGVMFFLPSIVCILLALQWGGTVYDWSEWREIVLLTFFAVLFVAFVIQQYLTGETTAMIPTRIIKQRSIIAGSYFTLCIAGAMMTVVYYLPLWFQAIKNVSAIKSGIMTLPLILSLVVGSMSCGAMVQRFGYYTPFMFVGVTILSIGAGLLTTLETDSGHAKWIGYQVLVGFGIGSCFQQSNLAAQRVLPNRDVPTGSSLIFFFQTFGGALFISVGQNVFLAKLVARLQSTGVRISPKIITASGATELRSHVPAEDLKAVLEAYNYALTHGPFLLCVCLACVAIFGALGMEWLNIKEKPGSPKGGAPAKAADEEKAVEAEGIAGVSQPTETEKTLETALTSTGPIPPAEPFAATSPATTAQLASAPNTVELHKAEDIRV